MESEFEKHCSIYYMRVSTEGQNIDRQLAKEDKIPHSSHLIPTNPLEEKESGRIPFRKRKQGSKIIKEIEIGYCKEVIVYSIDRLGRSTLDILKTIEYFNSKGVNLISIKEGLNTLNADGTENITAKLIISILSTLAEWDYTIKRTAQLEGIEVAKAKGKYKGRRVGTNKSNEEILKKYKRVVQALEEGNSLRSAAAIGGVSLGTAQKVKRIAIVEEIL